MRISRQQVAENREHLLAVALTEFREHGFDGVGVADVMKAAGMSLGSFYGYFDSKEQLVAETSARAMSGTKDLITGFLCKDNPEALSEMVDGYLSSGHRDNLSGGCALAALGSEMTHQPESVRRGITTELLALLTDTGGYLAGPTKAARDNSAISLMASLVGGLMLSRMVDDPKLSDRILKAVSKSIKQSNQPADADQQQ
jgi:TetR/AcrR family transcriptional repressor of nem operon